MTEEELSVLNRIKEPGRAVPKKNERPVGFNPCESDRPYDYPTPKSQKALTDSPIGIKSLNDWEILPGTCGGNLIVTLFLIQT